MGTILQFAERLVEDGDWTPAERSQLRDMGIQLGQTAAGLDLVFGKTEEGDPWCVVADERSEVLLHVARIGGGFVVHAPRNDQVIESHDLWLAVSRVLGGVLRDRRGLVLPFAPEVMGQPTVLALMVAAAVRGDFSEAIQGAQNALPALVSHNDRPEAAPALAAPVHDQEAVSEVRRGAPLAAAEAATPADQHLKVVPAVAALALVAATQSDAAAIDAKVSATNASAGQEAAAARAAPEPGQPAPGALAQITSLAAPAPEHSNGAATVSAGTPNHGGAGFAPAPANAGNAVGGAVAGASDAAVALAGEAGRAGGDSAVAGASVAPGFAAGKAVVVHSTAIAVGELGTPDVFILTAPVRTEGSNVISLGVVAGFSLAEGDRLVFANGATPTIVEVIELSPLSASASGLTGDAARRISYDFNGDGVEDAFVVVVDAATPLELHKAANTGGADAAAEYAVTLQGVVAAAGAASITVTFIGQ